MLTMKRTVAVSVLGKNLSKTLIACAVVYPLLDFLVLDSVGAGVVCWSILRETTVDHV